MIGRHDESAVLKSTVSDNKSHFVAVYGRRRIGKTFLIKEAYGNRFTFQHAGLADGTRDEQLFAFEDSLRDSGCDVPTHLKSWMEAFDMLKKTIINSTEKKKVVFIDELSWMDTPKSRLIVALEHFWNTWVSAQEKPGCIRNRQQCKIPLQRYRHRICRARG